MKRPRPRMRMKRLLLLLLAYTVGGAIINVAVAWVLAVYGTVMPTWTDGEVAADYWMHTIGRAPSVTSRARYEQILFQGNGYECLFLSAGLEAIHRGFGGRFERITDFVNVVRVGYPFLCLQAQREFQGDNSEWMRTAGAIRRSLDLCDDVTFQKRPLPIHPLWPGFAINTIFYAAILWLLFAAPGFVRRRIRARRGQCPACAYPVGASDVCTECGRPVKSINAETYKAEMV